MTNTKAGLPPATLSFANYVLNPNGNRVLMTDTTGVTQYNYDVLDRLSSVTYPGAPLTAAYSYDGAGNRLTQQVDANPATAYAYDEADQLTAIDGVGNNFDKNGNLLTIGATNPLLNNFLYDQENRLLRTGPCRGDVNGDGKANSTDLNIVGQHAGAEGTAAFDLALDVNGDRRVNSTDLLIVAQESGKNCKSTGPNTGNGRSWYDGDGLRVRQRTFAATNPSIVDDDYTWDAGAGLPVVLQDKRTPEGGAAATTTYLYGLGLISATSGAGVTSYYLADGLGSTTRLTDSAGAITDSYSYDVFGAPRTTTGTTANDFRYTGQQDDRNANRGLYFLRARSYDPALGRFLSRDVGGDGNAYSYSGDDPVNFLDPSGQCRVDVVLSKSNHWTNRILSRFGRAWYHIYLISADPITGEKEMHAAGPADDGSGLLEGKFPSLLEGDALANYKNDRKKTVYDDAGSCQSINQSFDTTGAAINKAQIRYHYWNTNSNAYARSLLEDAGIRSEKPGGWTPGWKTHLSY